ncbi:hypothetical protein GGF46_001827 [Coemansia sp. RSA 552]|nr:hypothetical protein GGF46_001827 [Coemansia sp. RSA 552]
MKDNGRRRSAGSIAKDRSVSRNGADKSLKKNGAGASNWGTNDYQVEEMIDEGEFRNLDDLEETDPMSHPPHPDQKVQELPLKDFIKRGQLVSDE